ncbi:MAG: hypothetical protein HUJ53_08660 [Holdemanella sp.]|nr:hypothetical protein [Holdemanella sp.]
MKFNIYEYIYYYFLMDEEALSILIAYFRPIVHNVINGTALENFEDVEEYEFLSLADVTLVNCIHSYRINQKAHFITYYKKAVQNQLYTFIRKLCHYSYPAVSMDAKISEHTRYQYVDILGYPSTLDTHAHVLLKMEVEAYEKVVQRQLKSIDYDIFTLLKENYSNREIAKTLHISDSKVRYEIKKIQKLLLSIDKA